MREQVALGCFPSEQQLVNEALQLLKAERDESLEGIRQGLADAGGRKDAAGGRSVCRTATRVQDL